MNNGTKTERNAAIVDLHVNGRHTLTGVGDIFGITKECVRQLVRRAGVSENVTAAVQRERKRDAWVAWICAGCGRTHVTIPSATKRFCSPSCKRPFLLNEMRKMALRLGHTPRATDLRRPSCTTYRYHFGKLGQAQTQAGLMPNTRGTRRLEPLPDGFREQWSHLLETSA